jgi:hypothetical protein
MREVKTVLATSDKLLSKRDECCWWSCSDFNGTPQSRITSGESLPP